MLESTRSKSDYKANQSFTNKILCQFSNKNHSKPDIKKYGTTPLQRNANRLTELTKNWRKSDNLEIRYRMDIQKYYILFGKVPDHFIEP